VYWGACSHGSPRYTHATSLGFGLCALESRSSILYGSRRWALGPGCNVFLRSMFYESGIIVTFLALVVRLATERVALIML